MNFTKEQITKAMSCKSVGELLNLILLTSIKIRTRIPN